MTLKRDRLGNVMSTMDGLFKKLVVVDGADKRPPKRLPSAKEVLSDVMPMHDERKKRQDELNAARQAQPAQVQNENKFGVNPMYDTEFFKVRGNKICRV